MVQCQSSQKHTTAREVCKTTFSQIMFWANYLFLYSFPYIQLLLDIFIIYYNSNVLWAQGLRPFCVSPSGDDVSSVVLNAKYFWFWFNGFNIFNAT